MTKQKHLKRRVRDRMEKTGESYSAARRHVLAARPDAPPPSSHIPGSIPAVSAFRTLLHERTPADQDALSEAMVFGIAGGIGIGVFSFRYESEDFSSFYMAGRHRWEDDAAYLDGLARRLGMTPTVQETGGASTARKQLDHALESGRLAIAWVDMGSLPYHGRPAGWEGGGYHVLVVRGMEGEGDAEVAVLSDLTDDPIRIPRDTLESARSRIRKFKHRIMTLDGEPSFDLREAVDQGIRACVDGLRAGRNASFRLEALPTLADRIEGKGGKQSWDAVFPRGRHLWTALTWTYDCIEHMGTGGGLCRPMFGAFLVEAGERTNRAALSEIGERYLEIGRGWSALAETALPDDRPALREAKTLYAEKAELFLTEGDGATPEYERIWARLGEIGAEVAEDFPMSESDVSDLRSELARRVRELHTAESEALDELAALV